MKKSKIKHYLKVTLICTVGSIILLFPFWLLNGKTILTELDVDTFIEENHECLTNSCFDTYVYLSTSSPKGRSYIVPYIIDNVHYKGPYYLDYSFEELKFPIKEYSVEIRSANKVVKRVNGTQKDIKNYGGLETIAVNKIPFNAYKNDDIDIIVEYTSVQNDKEIKHKDVLKYSVVIESQIGFQFWWNWMSI